MFFHVFILLFAGTQISIAQDVIEGDTLGRWEREGTFPIANGSRLDCHQYAKLVHERPRILHKLLLTLWQLLVD